MIDKQLSKQIARNLTNKSQLLIKERNKERNIYSRISLLF